MKRMLGGRSALAACRLLRIAANTRAYSSTIALRGLHEAARGAHHPPWLLRCVVITLLLAPIQNPAGARVGVPALVEREFAVHEHMLHADRILVRVFVGRTIGDGRRIE